MYVFIQARMSSRRLCGKVLKKIGKKAILERVITNIKLSNKIQKIVILTSKNKSDDVIVNFCKRNKITYFRGSLNNVAKRFYDCANFYDQKYFARISADSPFIDYKILDKMISIFKKYNQKFDIYTNVFPKTFPKGQSIEIINANIFNFLFKKKIKKCFLEHITSFFYKNSNKFKIFNFRSNKNFSKYNLCIDTKNDYNFFKRKIKKINKHSYLGFKKYIEIFYE